MTDFFGTIDNDTLTGSAGQDTLYGYEGNDQLEGLEDADTLIGGAGDDLYLIDALDTLVELDAEGVDTVQADFSYTLGDYLENLRLTGAGSINGTGNARDNTLTGNGQNNVLDGGDGYDSVVLTGFMADYQFQATLSGDLLAVGNGVTVTDQDTLRNVESLGFSDASWQVDMTVPGQMTVFGSAVADTMDFSLSQAALTLYGGMGPDLLTGGNGDDAVYGGDGGDALQGGGGNDFLSGIDFFTESSDTLSGGTGDDTYLIDGSDQILENAGGGTDTVRAGFSYTLGSNLENLILTGTSADSLTGNSLANRLEGNSAANFMAGGQGDDTYVIDAGDTIFENLFQGTDTVVAGFSYTLADDFENLTLTGADNINGTGNSAANVLRGNAGINVLTGGAGNDVYYLGAGDTAVEVAGGGTDTVHVTFNYTLAANFEQVVAEGGVGLSLLGNSGANTLTGGIGHDTLNGSSGADVMIGGAGNDNYSVDNAGDVVVELDGGGIDRVVSLVSLVLPDFVENLTLSGNRALSGAGNAGNNALTGNSGNNELFGLDGNDTLNGGAGADTLDGGAGNDTYVIVDALDVIIEQPGGGTDRVNASLNYSLGADLENLTLQGAGHWRGEGNELSNVVMGNSWNNDLSGLGGSDTLKGGEGDDTLAGGAGNDALYGGAGNDTYIIRRADSSSDAIVDADATAGNSDLLWFDDATISHEQLWLGRTGNDLVVTVLGTTTRAVIKGWYLSTDNQVETIRAGDGEALLAADVNSLVSAMAAFGTRPGGSTSLTTAEHTALDSIIAASWN